MSAEKLAEAMRKIAGYSMSQFRSQADMSAQCVDDAAKAIAAHEAEQEQAGEAVGWNDIAEVEPPIYDRVFVVALDADDDPYVTTAHFNGWDKRGAIFLGAGKVRHESKHWHPMLALPGRRGVSLTRQPKPVTPDSRADLCEAWLQGGGAGNIVDAYEAGFRDAERAHGITKDAKDSKANVRANRDTTARGPHE